jgi:hypothetical protein
MAGGIVKEPSTSIVKATITNRFGFPDLKENAVKENKKTVKENKSKGILSRVVSTLKDFPQKINFQPLPPWGRRRVLSPADQRPPTVQYIFFSK